MVGNVINKLIRTSSFTLLWSVFPLLVSFVSVYFGILSKKNIFNISTNTILFLFALMLGLINYTSEPISDLANYYNFIEKLGAAPSDFFYNVFTDFLFYISSTLIYLVTKDVHYVILFWTTLSYYLFFKALEVTNSSFINKSNNILFLVVVFSISMTVLFNTSNHLVRQFFAVSSLTYGIVLLSNNQDRAWVYFISSFMVHFSAILFLPLFFLKKISPKAQVILVLSILMIFTIVGSLNVIDIIYDVFSYFSGSSYIGSLTVAIELNDELNSAGTGVMYLLKLLVFFLLSVAILLASQSNRFIAISFIYIISIILLFRNTDFIVTRLFMYPLAFTSLIVLVVLKTARNKNLNMLFFGYCMYALYLFSINISNAYYIKNDFALLFVSMYSYLSYW